MLKHFEGLETITVIMPVYNAERYVAEAIESVLQQTYQDFILMIINDGSTDRSAEIIKRYAGRDSRIMAISQSNIGQSESLNKALSQARTTWVARMDADDIMLPLRLERQVAFLAEHPEITVLSCRAIYIDEWGAELGRTANHIKTLNDLAALVARQRPIAVLHPGVLMHRQAVLDIGGYRDHFTDIADVDLWTRLAEQGYKILIQDEVLMKYRIHPVSMIASAGRQTILKRKWIQACIRARQSGTAEPDWETFQANWKSTTPFWARLNWYRKVLAMHWYRTGGHQVMEKHWLAASVLLILAGMLSPMYVCKRLKMQILQ